MGNCWSGVISMLESCTKPQYEPIEERRSKLNAELAMNPVVDIVEGTTERGMEVVRGGEETSRIR